ncbi:integrase, catalytic region, zinc finger, CCHC-type containing protein [Tanacetum coccineum]
MASSVSHADYENEPSLDFQGNHADKSKTGGWLAAGLILGTELSQKICLIGISVNLVTYLQGDMHFSSSDSANTVTNCMGSLNLLALFGGFLADAKLGRFLAIVLFSSICTIGPDNTSLHTIDHESELEMRSIMDDPNITIEEYIRFQEEKAQRVGRTFNWQTATYGKVKYYEDEDDCFTTFESEFPVIVFDDTSDAALFCEPTVSLFNDNKIDFRISFDKSDDEDYTVIHDENSFSYKIISVNDLKMDSENNNDKVNMPLFSTPEPEVSYSNDLDFFKDFENEFSAIVYNDALTSKSDFLTEPTDNDIDEIDIEQSSGDMSVVPLPIRVPIVINTDDGAYALRDAIHFPSHEFVCAIWHPVRPQIV